MISKNEKNIRDRLEKAGQDIILSALDRLKAEKRTDLIQQLKRLDWERLENLRALLDNPPGEKQFDKIEPAPVKRLPRDENAMQRDKEAADAGRRALEDDRVAALTVAGGQGTRLGYDGPKGAFPITPVRKKSLFRYLGEKVRAARQKYNCRMPWLIMTSPTNDSATKEFFRANDFFGMKPGSVSFFTQNVNPILDAEGNLTRDENGALLVGPDGHGGVYEALKKSGLSKELQEEKFDLISYFQVDNPLVTVADERFLGYHVQDGAEFSCKVIAKRNASEGLGVAVLENSRPGIVEYIDLPETMADAKTPDGELKFLFGSIAVHIINVDFAAAMADDTDVMEWHVAEKNYTVMSRDAEPTGAECYKFEKFVFDALPRAAGCAFVEVDRQGEFAPVKNAEGKDSPKECREMLQKKWMKRLKKLGIDVQKSQKGDILIEISPLESPE